MRREATIHTVPAGGTAWINRIGGEVLSRHRSREDAVAAGAVIAQSLEMEHVIHRDDGEVEAQTDDRTTIPA